MASIRETALKYCSTGRKTCRQVSDKLLSKDFRAESVEAEIEYLESVGVLDDAEYARCFVNDSVTLKKQGKRRIAYELRMRGISPEYYEHLLDELEEEIDEELAFLIEKKARSLDYTDRKDVQKLIRYCVYRGHSAGDTIRAMREYLEVQDEQDD